MLHRALTQSKPHFLMHRPSPEFIQLHPPVFEGCASLALCVNRAPLLVVLRKEGTDRFCSRAYKGLCTDMYRLSFPPESDAGRTNCPMEHPLVTVGFRQLCVHSPNSRVWGSGQNEKEILSPSGLFKHRLYYFSFEGRALGVGNV